MPIVNEQMKPWQKGQPLARLKEVASVFKQFDKGLVFGAFGGVKENTVADWIEDGKLFTFEGEGGRVTAAAAIVEHKGKRPIEGFCGPIGCPFAGASVVKRMACLPGHEQDLVDLVQLNAADELWVETFIENPAARACCEALGAEWVGSKVSAASEIVGVFKRGGGPAAPIPAAEAAAIEQMPVACLADEARTALAAISRVAPAFEQHYSTYNKAGSWSALALRGFGGLPGFIIKPAEMSRKWKEEHPDEIQYKCVDTPLRAQLRPLEALIAAIPGPKERIRLMKLAPGGGELLRHADITDPDAGVRPGRLMRIHIPLLTNPGVRFCQWLLDGSRKEASMGVGEAWYLDTRKPHTAINGGETERIHLVMDVGSNAKLLSLIGA